MEAETVRNQHTTAHTGSENSTLGMNKQISQVPYKCHILNMTKSQVKAQNHDTSVNDDTFL